MVATVVTTASQTEARTGTRRAVRIVGWTLRILLAATFANAAITKLTAQPIAAASFTELGGDPMMYAVGLLELAGAVGLLIPILSGVAAIGLTALLVIISTVTVATAGPSAAPLPVACLIVAAALVYLQRRQTVRIAGVLRRFVADR